MGWIQKLCDVYDHAITTDAVTGDRPLLPVGLTTKRIKYHVMLSEQGSFLSATEIPEDEQEAAVPTSPEAEARTSQVAPYPLAEQCKYLFCMDGRENPLFDAYLERMNAWSRASHAPVCLRVLTGYLEKRTLYRDILNAGIKLKFHKDDAAQDGDGADSKSFLCFSVNDDPYEKRLWMRKDVLDSWIRLFGERTGDLALCYATGEKRIVMESHPKVEGNAKLISAKDADFRFQYRGRFTEQGQAAVISGMASSKAHNALRWLMDHQGFRRFGMTTVAWHLSAQPVPLPAIQGFPFDDDQEDDDEMASPETFAGYAAALREASLGISERLENYQNAFEETKKRMDEVCILSMEAATNGRMSVIYYQEMPGDQYVRRIKNWYRECCWRMPRKGSPIASPDIRQIGRAVIGHEQVSAAMIDGECQKAATKVMREMSLRIMMCITDAVPLPVPYVRQAFQRAVAPLSFTDGAGVWQERWWHGCVATACALIRKMYFDRKPMREVDPTLDPAQTDRSYLYGRLLAVAHRMERLAGEDGKPTHAQRMMTEFVRRPFETWPKLHDRLLPYIRKLGEDRARRCQALLGEIESRFIRDERMQSAALSEMFLIGFHAQGQSLFGEPAFPEAYVPYSPTDNRDELFGCLLAVADAAEQEADAERAGATNALNMAVTFAKRPSDTWAVLHDKLLPYLEQLGHRSARYFHNQLCRIECRFDEVERASNAPLGSMALYGYYRMLALLKRRVKLEPPVPAKARSFSSREAVYGALLAEEDHIERIVLDAVRRLEERENRVSNAVRYLARAAKRPDDVWAYLRRRMAPYVRVIRFSPVVEKINRMEAILKDNGWNDDAPLRGHYLHYFYTETIQEEEET